MIGRIARAVLVAAAVLAAERANVEAGGLQQSSGLPEFCNSSGAGRVNPPCGDAAVRLGDQR
jgi:hypothetical protein